jgi:hypothetical protein
MAKVKFPHGIMVRVQESGWITEDPVDDWVRSVWFRQPGALLCQRSMLVLDSFRDQATENVKAQLRQEKCDLRPPCNHTRRHDRDVATTRRRNQSAI